jgi:P4 family phage/plasmid primase-like protien
MAVSGEVEELRNGVVIIGLEPVLRHRIWAVEKDLEEILAGPRVPDLEVSLGGRYEIHVFRLKGECLKAEGKRFIVLCRDLANHLKPGVISITSLELEEFIKGIPEVEPSKIKIWVEKLVQLDSELSRVEDGLSRLLARGIGGIGVEREPLESSQKPPILCLEGPVTREDGSRLAPLPSHTILCAQRLKSAFNVRKWLGNIYIFYSGRWVGEPDSIEILQAIIENTFEKRRLHEFNWRYTSFEKEVLKVLYAGAPTPEPVKGVRSGDYIIIWGDSGYEIRPYGGEFVVHDIIARVKPELLNIARARGYNAKDLALAEAPQLVEILKMWVGEPYWLTLLELVGYTTVAFRYPLNKAFMLLGQGSNGKSTFLRTLREILGKHNIASVPLQAFTNLDYRFLWTRLVGKLVNIFADLPKAAVGYTGVFKVITGEDCMDFDRKGKEPVGCYTNYAKMIFAANELPETRDLTHAYFRRWVLVEFPNMFPDEPGWYDKNITQELRNTALTVGLEAMREVLERRAFTGETYIKERWLEESDQIYKFIRVLEKLNLAKRDPKGRVEEKTLYKLYVTWAELDEVEPLEKKVFTERIARYGVLKPKKHYVGLMLLERPDVAEEKLKVVYEEREGLEAYREE